MKKDLAIGLDLGGTKILAALVTESGEIIDKIDCKTLTEQGESAVVERVLSSVQHLIERSQVDQKRVRGVGIAAAGVIDSYENKIVFANNLGWENVPIGDLIEKRLNIPVRLNNDANAAAVAEWIWGAGAGKENLIYITVSTGVGAGIISNGQLITGVGDSAGEFGHISINLDGPLCVCGNRGCLENVTSGTAIAKLARKRLESGEESEYFNRIQQDYSMITAKSIGEAAEQGDTFSINLLKEIGYYLGAGVTNLIHLFNTEVIVFGGGVMNRAEVLLPAIRSTVEERGIRAMVERVTIEKSALGINAGVMGAAGLFFTERAVSKTVCI